MVLKSVIRSALLGLTFQATDAVQYSLGCGNAANITSGTYTTTVNGTEREYILRVPEGYDPTVPYPVIITTYHWYGGTTYNVTQDSSTHGNGSYYGLLSYANESAIFVAPEGLNYGWWNTNDDDMTSTDSIVQTIDELCVDQEQRFVVGFSFGGSMTNAIAKSGRGTTFKAAAVLSGTDYTTAIGEPVPIGFFVSHGVSDPANPISKGRSMRDVFVEVNGCTGQTAPDPAGGSGSYIKTSYANCSKPVTFIAFDGVHQYSPVDSGASSSWLPGELWRFFFRSERSY